MRRNTDGQSNKSNVDLFYRILSELLFSLSELTYYGNSVVSKNGAPGMAEENNEAYLEQIEVNLQRLGSEKAAVRREAAYQLGELAAADALPDLIDLYKNDPDPGVRKAAAYALGMFRAVENAIESGKREKAEALLEAVEEGDVGHRSNRGSALRNLLGLLLSLALLVGLYFVLPGLLPNGGIPAPRIGSAAASAPANSRAAVAAQLQPVFQRVRNDTTQLQTQFTGLLGGQQLDCAAFFNNPQPVSLAPADASAYPELNQVAVDINAAIANLNAAFTRYDQSCSGVNTLPLDQVGTLLRGLVANINMFPTLESELAAAGGSAQPTVPPTNVPPTTAPVVAPTTDPGQSIPPTTAPAAAPTTDPGQQPAPTTVPPTTVPPTTAPVGVATVDPVNLRLHLRELYARIDRVTQQRGASTLLTQYWADVLDAGRTDGCNATVPEIPETYTVLPESDAVNSRELGQAVQLINTGLNALRDGWNKFRGACRNGGLTTIAQAEYQLALVTNNTFEAALELLDELRVTVEG
jgi:hypothetical protein